MTTISLCQKCQGSREIFLAPENLDFRDRRAVSLCRKPCPACRGTGLTEDLTATHPTGKMQFTRKAFTIVGPSQCTIRLTPYPPGYDLWIDKKKITRGRKYMKAADLNAAMRQLLFPSEHRGPGIAVFA